MTTECTAGTLQFQAVARRSVQARFDGGALTSDGGAVLLREVDRATGIRTQFAAVDRMLVDVFLQANATPPTELVLDLDATDDPVRVRAPWTNSGFCRDALMTWAEAHGVDLVFGLAKHARLTALIPEELAADGKSNPRFVMTSLPLTTVDARTLYEEVYCARGEMENRIWVRRWRMRSARRSGSPC